MTKHIFNKSILKAYDIRGMVDDEITEKDAYFVGKSYGTLLRMRNLKSCVLGYDGRHTSVPYSKEVVKGLRECGIDVINIGLVPTPMLYFAVKHLKQDAGIVITASHNPANYNGFKMLTDSAPVWDADIQEIGEIAKKGDFIDGEKQGTYEEKDLEKDYLDFLLSNFKKGKKKLNVVWDAGNGSAGAVLDDLVARLPGKHKTIFSKVDGSFPNHHPDPSIAKNMQDLKREVLDGGYDFGIAFDGDGDRLGIVDDKGFIMYGDELLIILARDFLKKNPGERVLSEVKSSKVLFDDIEKHGGIPFMWKAGHSVIKEKMVEDNIKLAGETSGHMYYGDNHNFDDALYAGIKLLDIMSKSDETISQIRENLPKTFATREIRITVGDEKKFIIPKEIEKRLKSEGRDFVGVDGVRANLKQGWWLVRTSNTQPDLTTRCEALSKKGLEIVKADLKKQLKLSGVDIDFEE